MQKCVQVNTVILKVKRVFKGNSLFEYIHIIIILYHRIFYSLIDVAGVIDVMVYDAASIFPVEVCIIHHYNTTQHIYTRHRIHVSDTIGTPKFKDVKHYYHRSKIIQYFLVVT